MSLPDLIEIVPLGKTVRAEITVPGSKSITNRALILAALADGEVTLEGALWSEDTQVMVEALKKLGFEVNVAPDPNEICNRTITVKGLGGKISNGGTAEKPLELFVGNAGTAARFLSALVCLGNGVYRLHGVPRMHERPQAALFKALREFGYRVEAENGNEKLPVRIFGESRRRGNEAQTSNAKHGTTKKLTQERVDKANKLPLKDRYVAFLLLDSLAHVLRPRALWKADTIVLESSPSPTDQKLCSCTVSIEESSQFASALLLCAKVGGWTIEVVGENAEESSYVAMTIKLIEAFPNLGGKFQIEPDASSGSYFLAAGAGPLWRSDETHLVKIQSMEVPMSVMPFDSVTIKSWPKSGLQVDQQFRLHLDFVLLGTEVESHIRGMINILNPKSIISRQENLGDSIMTAIVLAPFAPEHRKFVDLGRLRLQETERVVALRTELTKCGAKVIEEGDTLTVYPSKLHGAEIETYNDHRMAMCFAILGLKVPGIKIKNPSCVKKTFPNFFQKLAAPPPGGLGAEILDAAGKPLSLDQLFAD